MSLIDRYALIPLPQNIRRFPTIAIPGSKSSTLRSILLAAVWNHPTKITNVLRSEDTEVMIKALIDLGASISFPDPTTLIIQGPLTYTKEPKSLHLGESGLSLRLLLAHLSFFGKGPISFYGGGRLLGRPIDGLLNSMVPLGVSSVRKPNYIEVMPNALPSHPVKIHIDASISSQWVSALAMALAHHPYGGTIFFKELIVSRSYLDLTSYWLNTFGCQQHIDPTHWVIPGCIVAPQTCAIEGDWSSASPFILASAMQGIPITLQGLGQEEPQGDRYLLDILSKVSVTHKWEYGNLSIEGKIEGGIFEDLSSCPDLTPVLATACVFGTQVSHLKGLHTLPDKESNRIEKIKEMIYWLGGTCKVSNCSEIIIYPKISVRKLSGAFDPDYDHRMAFAAALGCLSTGGVIINPNCVKKTFPEFWTQWSKLFS